MFMNESAFVYVCLCVGVMRGVDFLREESRDGRCAEENVLE